MCDLPRCEVQNPASSPVVGNPIYRKADVKTLHSGGSAHVTSFTEPRHRLPRLCQQHPGSRCFWLQMGSLVAVRSIRTSFRLDAFLLGDLTPESYLELGEFFEACRWGLYWPELRLAACSGRYSSKEFACWLVPNTSDRGSCRESWRPTPLA